MQSILVEKTLRRPSWFPGFPGFTLLATQLWSRASSEDVVGEGIPVCRERDWTGQTHPPPPKDNIHTCTHICVSLCTPVHTCVCEKLHMQTCTHHHHHSHPPHAAHDMEPRKQTPWAQATRGRQGAAALPSPPPHPPRGSRWCPELHSTRRCSLT